MLPLQKEKIINHLTRDELHEIAKFCDDIIVERFIKN